jgi:hypothetical protein
MCPQKEPLEAGSICTCHTQHEQQYLARSRFAQSFEVSSNLRNTLPIVLVFCIIASANTNQGNKGGPRRRRMQVDRKGILDNFASVTYISPSSAPHCSLNSSSAPLPSLQNVMYRYIAVCWNLRAIHLLENMLRRTRSPP